MVYRLNALSVLPFRFNSTAEKFFFFLNQCLCLNTACLLLSQPAETYNASFKEFSINTTTLKTLKQNLNNKSLFLKLHKLLKVKKNKPFLSLVITLNVKFVFSEIIIRSHCVVPTLLLLTFNCLLGSRS